MSQVLAGGLFDWKLRYPLTPGSKPSAPETSRLAAIHAKPTTRALRDAVMARLRKDGPLTADECAERLDACVLAVRPRFSELVAHGEIRDSGARRQNVISGKSAVVWMLTGTRNLAE